MSYKGKTVLVTGAAGFIGGALTRHLLNEGAEVWGFDNLSIGKTFPKGCIPIKGDVTNFNDVYYATQKADIVFHAACCCQEREETIPLEGLYTNGMGTLNVINVLNANSWRLGGRGLQRFVYVSSASVYGVNRNYKPWEEDDAKDPVTLYGATKLLGESYTKLRCRVPWSVVRLSNVYGPGMLLDSPYCGAIGKFAKAALNNTPVTITADSTRDYTYIDDVVEALALLGPIGIATHEKTFNISTGRGYTPTEIVSIIKQFHDWPAPVISGDKRAIDQIRWRVCNPNKIAREVGWKATTTQEHGIFKFLMHLSSLKNSTNTSGAPSAVVLSSNAGMRVNSFLMRGTLL